MGKYIDKGDVALMDLAANQSIGVRTRAKTLALRRLQSSAADFGYLQLRSRRLEKSPLFCKRRNPNSVQKQKQGHEENPRPEKAGVGSGLESIEKTGREFEAVGLEIEAGLGENDLGAPARGRTTRESTPCNLIVSADIVKTPVSTTKRRSPTVANQSTQTAPQSNSTAGEMDEFLARIDREDKLAQQRFMEKYNFDVVNDKPLAGGRYEWERIAP